MTRRQVLIAALIVLAAFYAGTAVQRHLNPTVGCGAAGGVPVAIRWLDA